jgi:hypothetical protein
MAVVYLSESLKSVLMAGTRSAHCPSWSDNLYCGRKNEVVWGSKWRRFMTDYHTVIAQAVESLDQNTSRTRRAVYERARTAQVTHLRAIHPPLSESEIAKERLSLESAIRKVEADTAGIRGLPLRHDAANSGREHGQC